MNREDAKYFVDFVLKSVSTKREQHAIGEDLEFSLASTEYPQDQLFQWISDCMKGDGEHLDIFSNLDKYAEQNNYELVLTENYNNNVVLRFEKYLPRYQ